MICYNYTDWFFANDSIYKIFNNAIYQRIKQMNSPCIILINWPNKNNNNKNESFATVLTDVNLFEIVNL